MPNFESVIEAPVAGGITCHAGQGERLFACFPMATSSDMRAFASVLREEAERLDKMAADYDAAERERRATPGGPYPWEPKE